MGEGVLGRVNSQCKGPEVGEYLVCLRSSEEPCVPGVESRGGRGNPGALTQYSREEVAMTWIRVVDSAAGAGVD